MNNFEDVLDEEITESINQIIVEAIINTPDAEWFEVLAKSEIKKVVPIFGNKKRAYSYISIAASILLIVTISAFVFATVNRKEKLNTTEEKKKVTPSVPTVPTTSTEVTTSTTTLPTTATTKKGSGSSVTTSTSPSEAPLTISSVSADDIPHNDQGFATDSVVPIVRYTLSKRQGEITINVKFYVTDHHANTSFTSDVQMTTSYAKINSDTGYVNIDPINISSDHCAELSYYGVVTWPGGSKTTNTAWAYGPESMCGPHG